MPTPYQLEELARWPHSVLQGAPLVREIFLTNEAQTWLRQNLPNLDPAGFYEGALSPKLQLIDVFRRFMVGETMNALPPKTLRDHPEWIHEIRTHDLRVFGWFYRSDAFIAARVDTKARLKSGCVTYAGYIQQCCLDRERLDLDEPKFVEGSIDDILQSRN